MVTSVAAPIDASSATADIAARIDTLSPGANIRVGSYTIGTKVVFYTYDIA